MINTVLNVDDICQDCPYFSVETNSVINYCDMYATYNTIYISCEHRDLCNYLKKYIEEEMNKNERIL